MDNKSKITKKDKLDFIRRVLSSKVAMARKALLMIYQHGQTPIEQASNGHGLQEKNGCGFTAFDCEILTSFAEQLLAKDWLSERQDQILMNKMPRYARQILDMEDDQRLCAAIMRERNAENPRP